MSHRAFIERISAATYYDQVRRGLEYIRFGDLLPPNGKVFIKPNLTYPTYQPGVMTSPTAIEAALRAIREYTPNIFIGDADSGGYNRFSMDEVYRETGVSTLAERYGVNLVNLSRLERRAITFRYRGKVFHLDLPRLLTDEIDMLVTMPVPKIHMNTGVSLSFKNQWGCIPEPADRLRLHPYFQRVILEVNRAIKTRVTILDGTYGLNVSGPLRGTPVPLNWVLVADHPGVAARLGCELMGVPLRSIAHLRYAERLGVVPPRTAVVLNQSLTPFIGERFYLKRKWTDYPGMLAFKSPFLAYIAYFSPLSDLLHRLLYLVREPFYDYEKYGKPK